MQDESFRLFAEATDIVIVKDKSWFGKCLGSVDQSIFPMRITVLMDKALEVEHGGHFIAV